VKNSWKKNGRRNGHARLAKKSRSKKEEAKGIEGYPICRSTALIHDLCGKLRFPGKMIANRNP
jgi:hypothetical protein